MVLNRFGAGYGVTFITVHFDLLDGSFRLHRGIDAQSYLTDLFTRLANPAQTTESLDSLTPQGWPADRKSAAQTPAF